MGIVSLLDGIFAMHKILLRGQSGKEIPFRRSQAVYFLPWRPYNLRTDGGSV